MNDTIRFQTMDFSTYGAGREAPEVLARRKTLRQRTTEVFGYTEGAVWLSQFQPNTKLRIGDFAEASDEGLALVLEEINRLEPNIIPGKQTAPTQRPRRRR